MPPGRPPGAPTGPGAAAGRTCRDIAAALLAAAVSVATAAPADTALNLPSAASASDEGRCELVIAAAREPRELARLPLDAGQPEVRIAFVHSVLGREVVDRYRFLPQPVLVEEVFEGQGYGLPDGPGPGERWEVMSDGRIRLSLHRPVDPLIVLALPAQRMRILRPEGDLLLGSLGVTRVHLRVRHCPPAPPVAPPAPTR